MAIAVVKKEGESNEKLVSRFEKKVQQGRAVQFLRRNRYHKRNLSRRKIRLAGLKRVEFQTVREKLKFYQ